MYFIKCENSTLYVASNGERHIKCKKTGEICCCQRYCPEKRNFELTPNAENCKLNPKNYKEEKVIEPKIEKFSYKKITKSTPIIVVKQEPIVEIIEQPIVKAEELKENIKQEEITVEKIDAILEDLGILDLETKSNEMIETKEEPEKELNTNID